MLCGFGRSWVFFALLTGNLGWLASAQSSTPPPAQAPPVDTLPQAEPLPPPQGQVIIQSHGERPPEPGEPGNPAPASATASPDQPVIGPNAQADLTDADRAALLISSYDLDARLSPVRSGLNMRAKLTVRNIGSAPLKQLALQISSTLHWDSATLVNGVIRTHLALAQHQLDTDADHTGAETEAILPLPKPLGPNESVSLDLFYSGTIVQSAGRLQRLGASAAQQGSTDWDAISPGWTGVRGFGNVLWYPVATPQLFFAEGNTLFEAVGRTRLREDHASVHLRLGVDYVGGSPIAAYFCGRRRTLTTVPDDPDAPAATGTGVATADFPGEPLGFRTLSLFLLPLPETFPGDPSSPGPEATSTSSSSSSTSATTAVTSPTTAQTTSPQTSSAAVASAGPPFLALETNDSGGGQAFAAAADHVAPLLREWLGAQPLSALTAIDHEGQPFQDGPLLVGPVSVLAASTESSALVESLSHAWVQTGQPWMDDGLAQFFSLLWVEREQGHAAANAQLDELMRPVNIAEPDVTAQAAPGAVTPLGQPLIAAADDLFYRRKAAAVWWMLRGIVGDGNLHAALGAWRIQPASQAPAAEQAVAFEHLLEKLSSQDLSWFFTDWVLRDRGLPDLNITDLAAASETTTPGHPSGWLVAVTVRNEGGAVADVPVIVRSGAYKTEQRMRIPGFSTVTKRVLVETSPTGVQVNDGSTPEVVTSIHTRDIHLQTR